MDFTTLPPIGLVGAGLLYLLRELQAERAAHKATRLELETKLAKAQEAEKEQMRQNAKDSALYLKALARLRNDSSPPPSSPS